MSLTKEERIKAVRNFWTMRLEDWTELINTAPKTIGTYESMIGWCKRDLDYANDIWHSLGAGEYEVFCEVCDKIADKYDQMVATLNKLKS